jgi:hypothetical protein
MMRGFAALAAALAVFSACGYSPMNRAGAMSTDVTRLAVDVDEGTRGDPEFADALERSLRRSVRRDARFRLEMEPSAADAVLRVNLDTPVTRPVAFDRFDDPLDYETTIAVDARLEGRSGNVLWAADNVAATRAHAAVAGAVVTSSSAFVSSERLRPEDLAAFDTVQLGEQRLSHAREALADDLAATIYLRMMEGR